MSKPLYGCYVFIFTDDLGETEFRHLEERELPVLVELGSSLPLPLSWEEALSPVPTISLPGNRRALVGSSSVTAEYLQKVSIVV